MFNTIRWWFKRGVYGFRLDAVDVLYEDPKLRTIPAGGTDPYGGPKQDRIYDHSIPEVHAALQRMRRVVDEFPGRVLIGETWTNTPKELAEYYGPHNDELQLPMYFNFTTINKLDAARFRQRIEAVETNSAGGWPVFVLSNHDIIRQVDATLRQARTRTRWGCVALSTSRCAARPSSTWARNWGCATTIPSGART